VKVALALLLLLFFLPNSTVKDQSPAEGWRFPNRSDYRSNWRRFRSDVPMPYHVRADLNGDKIIDDAWILIPIRGKGLGLFVFIGQRSGKPRVVQLDYSENVAPQTMYLSEIEPGRYDTACGRGYWDCSVGEPAVLRLVRPGIVYAMYGSASSVFYWDDQRKEFARVWLTD
jgi:hypothetical protein